jgi:hypothetical protein
MTERWVLNVSPLIVLATVLQSVRRQGFRLDDWLIAAALKELGEENWL